MADIFSTENARELFQSKFVFMLGDSNMRATYKDLVLLMNRNSLLDGEGLRKRGEPSFLGDQRIVYSGVMKGRGYAEGREFLQHGVHIEYHFITRCYTEDIERFLRRIQGGTMKAPDVFIMNSCLWDISRWGPDGVDSYKENMKKLMLLLKECLPESTLFIWTTTLPVSSQIRGGLLIKQIDFLQYMLRFEIMEANLFCRQLVVSHGYDVLDIHYHLRMQIHRRLKDGLHYGPLPVRFITNLLLTHISLSWDIPLPGNSQGIALRRVIRDGVLQISDKSDEAKLPPIPACVNTEVNEDINEKTEKGKPFIKDYATRNINNNFHFNNKYKRRNRPITAWEPRNPSYKYWEKTRPEREDPPNEPIWNNHHRTEPWTIPSIPPWQQLQQQQQPQQDLRNQNFWQDNIDHRSGNSAPWNIEYKEQYQRSTFADFDRVGGPVRNNKFNKRTRPY